MYIKKSCMKLMILLVQSKRNVTIEGDIKDSNLTQKEVTIEKKTRRGCSYIGKSCKQGNARKDD